MPKFLGFLVLCAAATSFLPSAQAGDRDPGVNRRQHHQRHLTAGGVRSGELTRDETRAIAQDQRAIRVEERAYKADGKLTRDERKDLHQDLNATRKEIYTEKHDDEKRP